jgi:hypothetical protein
MYVVSRKSYTRFQNSKAEHIEAEIRVSPPTALLRKRLTSALTNLKRQINSYKIEEFYSPHKMSEYLMTLVMGFACCLEAKRRTKIFFLKQHHNKNIDNSYLNRSYKYYGSTGSYVYM